MGSLNQQDQLFVVFLLRDDEMEPRAAAILPLDGPILRRLEVLSGEEVMVSFPVRVFFKAPLFDISGIEMSRGENQVRTLLYVSGEMVSIDAFLPLGGWYEGSLAALKDLKAAFAGRSEEIEDWSVKLSGDVMLVGSHPGDLELLEKVFKPLCTDALWQRWRPQVEV